jgi:hypothetical protein
VVGSYDPEDDDINAAILDRNANLLRHVSPACGRLKVVRIPMPPREDGQWRTYTNVVFANGNLMVPVYPDMDSRGRRQALRTFSRLLPGWQITPVDASALSELGGSLHCITRNVGAAAVAPSLAELPENAEPFPAEPAWVQERPVSPRILDELRASRLERIGLLILDR